MEEQTVITGRFQGSGRGFGFLIPDGAHSRDDDYFVPPRDTGGAWDGDTVEAVPAEEDPRRPGKPNVRITKVLERGTKLVTGTIHKVDREVWLRPDSDRLPSLIKVVGKCRVRDGERAAVALVSYGSAKLPPTGNLKASFGPSDTRAAAVEATLYRLDIHRPFPPEVMAEAEAIPQKVPRAALRDRLDLRKETIITIDGASSKDLDDAVSLTRDGAGNWILGVHIADVSHYVQPGSPLDTEAYQRGTSVYFADQVIPMLPEALSNGICSLNPQVERLTLSCIMTLNPAGKVLSHTVAPSVIRSTERMTYDQCNTLLTDGDPALADRYAHILPMLRDMAALAAVLEKGRKARGSLDLESQESYILCDETGRAVDVVARTPGVSEGLIESFMLIANETVAKHLYDLHKPAVYRVHEKPSLDKAETLKETLAPLGYPIREVDNYTLQKVLNQVTGKPEAPAVNMMILRSLMKARYDVENLGHFGLAAPFYCHFTSPIRRYPDLMIHRCLHALWDKGEQSPSREAKRAAACARAAEQSSQREIAAQTAERDIDKLYFAEYMHGHLGEHFPATVSGVTAFGLFAALPSGVEGLIPVETLPEDTWLYDEKGLSLTGERTGARYTFGMELEVVCVSADPSTGRVDFRLPGREEIPAKPRREPAEPPQDRPRSGSGRTRGAAKGKRQSGRPAMHVPKRSRKGKRR